MATIPGAAFYHGVISDECRKNRGERDALMESLDRLWNKYDDLKKAWPIGKGAKIHVALCLERPTVGTIERLRLAYNAKDDVAFEKALEDFAAEGKYPE